MLGIVRCIGSPTHYIGKTERHNPSKGYCREGNRRRRAAEYAYLLNRVSKDYDKQYTKYHGHSPLKSLYRFVTEKDEPKHEKNSDCERVSQFTCF